MIVSSYLDNPIKYISAGGVFELVSQVPNTEIYIIVHEEFKKGTKKLNLKAWLSSFATSILGMSSGKATSNKYVTRSGIFNSFCELLGQEKFDQYKNALSEFIDAHPEKVFRFADLNSESFLENIKQQGFELGIARGGGILRKNFINLFELGILNLHGAGALPYYRGIGSLEFALVDKQSLFINIHYIDPGVDTGPILETIPIELDGIDSLNKLYAKIHILGIGIFVNMTKKLMHEPILGIKQDVKDGRQHFIPHPVFEKLAQERLSSKCTTESINN